MSTLLKLAKSWREDAELLERYGDTHLGTACRRHADELEATLRSGADEALDLAAAAAESGYSAERLRHKVAEGSIPNAGKKGSPRIRRGDLPLKRTRATRFDATAIARRILHSQHGTSTITTPSNNPREQ